MAAVRVCKLLQLNSAVSCHGALGCSGGRRQYSDDVSFLKNADTAHMRRGRGGRSSYSGTTCTVFGATGFLGRIVVNRLGRTGSQVVVPYRGDFYDVLSLKLAGDLGQILFYPYNLRDEEKIATAVKHSSVVINLVGREWPTLNYTLDQVHVNGAARIARACRNAGVERLIHVSALNCDRVHEGTVITGGSPVLAAKGRGEQAVLDEFPDATIIRPSDIFGWEDRFLRHYSYYFRRTYRSIALPNGGRNIFKVPVYVGDVAQAIANAATMDMDIKGKIFQAVGPHRYELREMVEWFLRVLRRSPDIIGGSVVTNTKYDPIPFIKAKLNDMFWSFPVNAQTTEKMERESVTDIVSNKLPGLEDLGVDLTSLEDRIAFELRPYRAYNYYVDEIGDFPDPAPCKYVNA